MRYHYKCSDCNHEYTCNVPMSEHKIPQPCPECSTENMKLFKPCVNHVFKGDGWSTKNERIKKQMRKKNEKLDARTNEMKRDAHNVTLAPNVDGERVDSWTDAQKLAKSKGKETKSYEQHIAKEKASK